MHLGSRGAIPYPRHACIATLQDAVVAHCKLKPVAKRLHGETRLRVVTSYALVVRKKSGDLPVMFSLSTAAREQRARTLLQQPPLRSRRIAMRHAWSSKGLGRRLRRSRRALWPSSGKRTFRPRVKREKNERRPGYDICHTLCLGKESLRYASKRLA